MDKTITGPTKWLEAECLEGKLKKVGDLPVEVTMGRSQSPHITVNRGKL